jgi:hypothetical protein
MVNHLHTSVAIALTAERQGACVLGANRADSGCRRTHPTPCGGLSCRPAACLQPCCKGGSLPTSTSVCVCSVRRVAVRGCSAGGRQQRSFRAAHERIQQQGQVSGGAAAAAAAAAAAPASIAARVVCCARACTVASLALWVCPALQPMHASALLLLLLPCTMLPDEGCLHVVAGSERRRPQAWRRARARVCSVSAADACHACVRRHACGRLWPNALFLLRRVCFLAAFHCGTVVAGCLRALQTTFCLILRWDDVYAQSAAAVLGTSACGAAHTATIHLTPPLVTQCAIGSQTSHHTPAAWRGGQTFLCIVC